MKKEKEKRLSQAEQYLEARAQYGIVRHYNAYGIADCLRGAGIDVTPDEAIEINERVRARHGYPPRERSYYLHHER